MDYNKLINIFHKKKIKICNIYGPTSSGKSSLALCMINKINSEVVNADSMQIYKEVSLLTGQPKVSNNHHLYGYVAMSKKYCLKLWVKDAINKIEKIILSNKVAIIVGGTGLYFKSLISGLSLMPEITDEDKNKINNILINNCINKYDILRKSEFQLIRIINKNDIVRIKRSLEVFIATSQSILFWQQNTKAYFSSNIFYNIFIKPERQFLYQKIDKKFKKLLESGAINEVKKLKKKYDIGKIPKIIGLKLIDNYLKGIINYNFLVKNGQQQTKNYAQKQFTWFNNQFIHDIIVNII